MWFVIHVKPGTEAQAVELMGDAAQSAGLQELFSPKSQVVHAVNGRMVQDELPLLPGCVVAVASSKWEVRSCLHKSHGIEFLLDGDRSFDEMRSDEVDFVNLLTQPAHRTVAPSEGTMRGGVLTIEKGPLAGHGQLVSRLSHRKRRAYLKTSVAGKPAQAEVGLSVRRHAGEPAAGVAMGGALT